MKKCTLILLVVLFSLLFANDFRFYADYATYFDNEKSFVELYYMLPRFAEETYTYLNKGATSERGRVLLKYGYPSEIQRSDIGRYTKDHEIWLYEGMRGDIQFVFYDTRGRGLYELTHSNMEGEIYNANWKDILTAGAKSY